MGEPGSASSANAFLGSLPEPVRGRIEAAAEYLDLAVRDFVYYRHEAVSHVYFPLSGVISNVCTMSDGSQIEVGVIGREGMTGIPLVFTGADAATDLYAQVAGSALKVPREVLMEALSDTVASGSPFLAYAEAQTNAIAQYAACNRLHTLEERFARWLIMVHDRVSGDKLTLTHQFLGLMLGVRRAGVTLAASTFQRAGLIEYRRGDILIRDRPALQSSACECYDVVEDRCLALMGYSIRKYRNGATWFGGNGHDGGAPRNGANGRTVVTRP